MSLYEKALDVLSFFIALRNLSNKGSKCSRFEFVFNYINAIFEFGKYDISFFFFGPKLYNSMMYGLMMPKNQQ